MKSRNVKSYLLGLFISFMLWYIQMWNYDTDYKKYPFPFYIHSDCGVLYQVLYRHKIGIGLMIFLVLGVYQALIIKRVGDKKEKQLLKSIISNLLMEKFKGDSTHIRITIFKSKRGYTFLLQYLYYSLIHNFKSHYEKGILLSHLKLTPNPLKKYLVIYTRKSNPHEDGTTTFFPVVSDTKKICGIPSQSVCCGAPSKVENQTFPNVDLKLIRNQSDLDAHPQASKIKAYMRRNKINNIHRLRCIHRLSGSIWSNPIFDKNEEVWGAVVVDIDDTNGFNFSTVENDLISYTKIIGLSIIHLN